LNPSLLIFLFSRLLFGRVIDSVQSDGPIKAKESSNHGSIQDWLKNFNIIAFPPLFFFSALFYTDMASTVFVFLSFQLFLDSQVSRSGYTHIPWSIAQILLGIWALLFRQTNIFWVAVFPAGLAIIQGATACSKTRPSQRNDYQSFGQVLHNAWVNSAIYDPPLTAAWFDGQDDNVLRLQAFTNNCLDYIKTAMSLLIVTLLNVQKILPTLIPFITLIFIFAAFVLWNGSVVLGRSIPS
jgi:alpha-1,2-glucosyltransferase